MRSMTGLGVREGGKGGDLACGAGGDGEPGPGLWTERIAYGRGPHSHIAPGRDLGDRHE